VLNFEHFERGYLLPKGCKDLIDVINLQAHPKAEIFPKQFLKESSLPPPSWELLVSEHATVGEIAALIKQKPYKIIADLMELGVFANVNQSLAFEVISQIISKYGYIAKRSA